MTTPQNEGAKLHEIGRLADNLVQLRYGIGAQRTDLGAIIPRARLIYRSEVARLS